MVARRTYYINNSIVAGFGRPKWSLVTNGEYTPGSGSSTTPTTPTTPTAPMLKHGSRGDVVKTL